MNIGIIGNGFVGNAVYQSVRDKVKTYVYDVDTNRSLNKYEETVKQKLVFVCLPTPMRMDGSCDLSLLDQFFANAPEYDFDEDTNPTYIIKSTVPIGTTRSYSDRYCKTIVHNPEFLTATRESVRVTRRYQVSTTTEDSGAHVFRRI